MKQLQSILAYAAAGIWVQVAWTLWAAPAGIWAGFAGASLAIAPAWFFLHYRGWVAEDKDNLAVDMGGAIAMTVFVRGLLTKGSQESLAALPTLVLFLIGAGLAGWIWAKWQERRSRS